VSAGSTAPHHTQPEHEKKGGTEGEPAGGQHLHEERPER
jgi:hypothetical protein